ncbi:chromate transporter [Oscillatoria sp. CS-180]|uniref:chromate transporter n=1 Tax=Oscillatoria sp. CS-180 TaxID=3021720 RepID=UPI00232BF46C|nr:chromate transporter [Oscillatoria sp. CS-180]MDB9525286.1 chromate transporter [Oscillatoria sp. CS-180]
MNILLELFLTFAYLDLISVGGALAVLPEMERQVVLVHGWMGQQAFAQAVALGMVVPGPNMLHVLHIGNSVAGIPGAIAAGFGMFGPTSLVLICVAWMEGGSSCPQWVQKFHLVCGPITIGLLGAATLSLSRSILDNPLLIAISVVAAVLSVRQLLSPTWILLLAALSGAASAAFLA